MPYAKKSERRSALEAIKPWLLAGPGRSATLTSRGALDLREAEYRARYDRPLDGVAAALAGRIHGWPERKCLALISVPRYSTAMAKKTPAPSAKRPVKKAAKAAPKAKTGLAEHPVLVGFTTKEHARIVRAAAKTELSARKFIHTATLTAIAEVL